MRHFKQKEKWNLSENDKKYWCYPLKTCDITQTSPHGAQFILCFYGKNCSPWWILPLTHNQSCSNVVKSWYQGKSSFSTILRLGSCGHKSYNTSQICIMKNASWKINTEGPMSWSEWRVDSLLALLWRLREHFQKLNICQWEVERKNSKMKQMQVEMSKKDRIGLKMARRSVAIFFFFKSN